MPSKTSLTRGEPSSSRTGVSQRTPRSLLKRCASTSGAHYLIWPEWRVGAGVQVHGGPTSIHVNFRTNMIGRVDAATADVAAIVSQLKGR